MVFSRTGAAYILGRQDDEVPHEKSKSTVYKYGVADGNILADTYHSSLVSGVFVQPYWFCGNWTLSVDYVGVYICIDFFCFRYPFSCNAASV